MTDNSVLAMIEMCADPQKIISCVHAIEIVSFSFANLGN